MTRETYTGFNPEKIAEYFQNRLWPVDTIPVDQVELVKVTKGASLECGDGRFDQLPNRKFHGIKVFGGINAIMAIHTGGDLVGLQRATELIAKFGATPGTHSAEDTHRTEDSDNAEDEVKGGCGFADLWIAGRLNSAVYPYQLSGELAKGGLRIGQKLGEIMRDLGGNHFRLNGNHMEVATRLNPFKGFTEKSDDGSRFKIDDWFMAALGIPDEVRFHKIAEAVEKLKPDAKRLEIIVP